MKDTQLTRREQDKLAGQIVGGLNRNPEEQVMAVKKSLDPVEYAHCMQHDLQNLSTFHQMLRERYRGYLQQTSRKRESR